MTHFPPSAPEVGDMVAALFTLISSLDRATRQSEGASTLNLLQLFGGDESLRPSDLATRRGVHPSLVTRQLRELERLGFVRMRTDASDRRSRAVSLTDAGRRETERLQQSGVDRFALFVADWDGEEVRTLTRLLDKLKMSKAAVAALEASSADSDG